MRGIGKKIGVLVLAVMIFLPVALVMLREKNREIPPPVAAAAPTEAVTEPAQTEPVQTELPQTQPATEPVELNFETVPHYFQTDYPYVQYGNGTIATSGCSMTCLAMAASYLTDHTYLPDEMAYHFGDYGKNNIERLEYGSSQLGLPYEKVFDWRMVRQGLEEGKVAIVMVNERSRFTTEQHFIVVTGLNDRGKVLVNDPAGYNYANTYLLNGFENGFEDYDLTNGFSGAWIYDKQAIPEGMALFDARKPEQPKTRYVGYDLPEKDIYTLACFACAIAGGGSEDLQQAVVETVLNRMFSEDYANTVHQVIYNTELRRKSGSLSSVEPGYDSYRAVTAAVYGPYVLPMDVLHFTQDTAIPGAWGQIEGYSFLYDDD